MSENKLPLRIGTTINDAIYWFEDGMGCNGDRRVATKMYEMLRENNILQLDDLGFFLSAEWNNKDFFDWWNLAGLEIDEIDAGMEKFLTVLEISVVKKTWDGESLNDAERQALRRLRVKMEKTRNLRERVAFFDKFDI